MAYTSLMYHIVFSTKDRRPLITPEALPRIREYIGGIIRKVHGQMVSANGTADHIHIAAIGSPNIAVMKFIQLIKGGSSKWIHETFPELKSLYWQESYGAFTVSPSGLPKLLAYIRDQEEHHKKADFKQEFLALLEKHGVKYDERYIWR
jgi:REP element-mobilizing transposase RayT